MPSPLDRLLSAVNLFRLRADVDALQAQQEQMMADQVTQAQVDELKAEFASSFAEIEKDIEALMAGQSVGAPMSQETFVAFKALAARAKAAGEVFTAPEPNPV